MFGDTKETKLNKSEFHTEGDRYGSQKCRKGKQWDLKRLRFTEQFGIHTDETQWFPFLRQHLQSVHLTAVREGEWSLSSWSRNPE